MDIGVFDGLTTNNIYLNLKLNDRWFINNSLRTSYFENAYYQLEIPITLQYKINEKWVVFMGPRLNFVNNYNSQNYNYQNCNFSLQFGTRYYFLSRFYAELFYDYNFLDPKGFSFGILNQGSYFRFGIGYQF